MSLRIRSGGLEPRYRIAAVFGLLASGCFVSDADIQSKLDDDGDNVPLGEDCAPNDRQFSAIVEWYADVDGDGFGAGDLISGCESERPTTNTADNADDCDDSNPSAYPGAEERFYDGVDQDCAGEDADGNGSNDDYDQDADGYEVDVDCDDVDPTLYPDDSLEEVPYDGVDNDCNLETGDGDKDGDGYWSVDYATKAPGSTLTPEAGFGGDCYDDSDAPEQDVSRHNGFATPRPDEVYPGSPAEVPYDGIDSACDGDTNEFDADGDGDASLAYPNRDGATGADCQDCTTPCSAEPEWTSEIASSDINTDMDEVFYDGVDQDCRGVDENGDGVEDDFDMDFDGYVASGYTDGFGNRGLDCIDSNRAAYPGATDTWYDGIDSDCGGEDDFDADRDGYVPNAYFGQATEGLAEGTELLDPGDCVDDPGNDLFQSGEAHWAAKFNPGATDVWYDGYDYDCAGDDDFDADGDGHRSDNFLGAADLSTYQQFARVVTASANPVDDCDDTDSAVSPSQSEVASNGIDDNCDNAAAPAGIEGDNITTEHHSGVIVGTTSSGLGERLAVGDLNGDGVDDILVAAPYDDDITTNGGVVSWFDGNDVLNQSTTDDAFSGAFVGTLGSDILGVGIAIADVDGDGQNDIIAGGPGAEDAGGVRVFLGTFSGTSSSPTTTADSAADHSFFGEDYESFGYSMTTADHSGDGVADLIVAAPFYDDGVFEFDHGAIYAIPVVGAPAETDAADYSTIYGNKGDDYIGYGSMVSGDFDGDGLDDVGIGSSVSQRSANWAGAGHIVEMPLADGAEIDDVALVSIASTDEYNYCGSATEMGDLDGDGYDEFAIGCYGYSNFDGLVSVFFGKATPSSSTNAYSADLVILGPYGWRNGAGSSIAFGDLNDDGTTDIMVGESLYGLASTRTYGGRVSYFDGTGVSGGTIYTSDADGHVISDTYTQYLGASMAVADDMDGDGDAELLIGGSGDNSSGTGSGEVFLFTGGAW